jgi:hypothetical protein
MRYSVKHKELVELILDRIKPSDIQGLCDYLRLVNSEIVEIKKFLEENGAEFKQLSHNDKKLLRRGGDLLKDISKITKNYERLK